MNWRMIIAVGIVAALSFVVGWWLSQRQRSIPRRLTTQKVTPKPKSPTLRPKPQRLPQDYAIPILSYHDISEKPSLWAVTPKQFEEHLKILKAEGFTFLTVSEAIDLLQCRWTGHIPQKAVIITLDDGYRSAYTIAFPLLRKYRAKATLCIYTSWIGLTSGALSWDELKEMVQLGIIEVASHTVTHPYPNRLRRRLGKKGYRDRMAWELIESKRELTQKLGVPVIGLAYPGGQFDPMLKELAKKIGYRWAVTINPEPMTATTDPFALPRFSVDNRTSQATLRHWIKKSLIAPVQDKFPKKTGARTSGFDLR